MVARWGGSRAGRSWGFALASLSRGYWSDSSDAERPPPEHRYHLYITNDEGEHGHHDLYHQGHRPGGFGEAPAPPISKVLSVALPLPVAENAPNLTVSRASVRAPSVDPGWCARSESRVMGGVARPDAARYPRGSGVSGSLSPCQGRRRGPFRRRRRSISSPKSRNFASTPRNRRCTTPPPTPNRDLPAKGSLRLRGVGRVGAILCLTSAFSRGARAGVK